MTTFQQTSFLSEILGLGEIPEEKLGYFRARLRHRFHAFVLDEFARRERDLGINKAALARRLGKRPEQITRWFATPGNWTLDTVSDLLLGMGSEARFYSQPLRLGAVHPSQEDWKNPRQLSDVAPFVGMPIGNMPAANESPQRLPAEQRDADFQQQPFQRIGGSLR